MIHGNNGEFGGGDGILHGNVGLFGGGGDGRLHGKDGMVGSGFVTLINGKL